MWGRHASTPGVRPAALAGTWYPEDVAKLRQTIEEWFAAVPHPESPSLRALVVPHAGLAWSGRTAAQAFARISAGQFRRVIVLAPNHRAPLRGAAVDPSTHYETPLGRMPVDTGAVAALAAHAGFVADARPFAEEHAIEIQLPFLQLRLPGATLVAVLVGEVDADARTRIAHAIAPLLDAETLLVVSSDFVHYGAAFGYVPFRDEIPARIHALDREAIEALLTRDPARFHAHLAATGATVCGRKPLGVLLECMSPAWRAECCAYTTSGDMTGDFSHSVSYASIAYEDAEAPAAAGHDRADALPSELEPAERNALLFAARQALEARFDPPPLATRLATVARTPRLAAPAGAFVSLHRRRDGRLRGCIGTLVPRAPLLQTVTDNAEAAACRDPRFDPVQRSELADLVLEVSVLGPLQPVRDVQEIEVGRDGLVVSAGSRRGVLLPQVATSQGWDRVSFLENVCRKAGLTPNAWREGAVLERFRAEVFGEDDASSGR